MLASVSIPIETVQCVKMSKKVNSISFDFLPIFQVQLVAISSGVILLGFIAGFFVGVKERSSKDVSRHPNKHHLGPATTGSANNADTLTGGGSIFHENPETFYHNVVNEIKGENIRLSMQ